MRRFIANFGDLDGQGVLFPDGTAVLHYSSGVIAYVPEFLALHASEDAYEWIDPINPDETGLTLPCGCSTPEPHDAHLAPGALRRLAEDSHWAVPRVPADTSWVEGPGRVSHMVGDDDTMTPAEAREHAAKYLAAADLAEALLNA